jgi:uncharacterized protein (TIGR00369 family)
MADPAADATSGVEEAREQFAGQGLMVTLGARLDRIEPGQVEIVLPVRPEISQHDGFVHAGAVTAILDTASGFAARTLMPSGSGVLSVDFTVHLMRPAVGDHIRAVASVTKPGRTITFVRAEAFAVQADGSQAACALMTATMMTMPATR